MAHTPYAYSFDLYQPGETMDRAKLVAQVQADSALTQALADVVVDTTARTVTYYYAAALDQTQQDALDACVAAYNYETLASAKARCIGDCRTFRDAQLLSATVEHPTSSGKHWPCEEEHQHYIATLVTNDSGSTTLRTADGLQDHTFADTAAIAALLADIITDVQTEHAACATAEANIVAASDIAAAEAARDAYVEA